MDLKQLRYFVTVAEEGSMTAAARKLYMSQPPITAQIHALEEELGCALLLRGARAVRLTDEGRLLYDRAKTMLELAQSTSEEIFAHVMSGSGTLRLGVVSSVAGTLLPGWLAAFHAAHPHVRFEIYEENTYQLLDKLRAGLIEVALVRTPFAAENLCCEAISSETLVAAGVESLLQPGAPVTLALLASRPLLLYRRWEHIAHRLFSDQGLTPRILLKSDNAATIAALVTQGLGVGLLPQSGALPLKREGVVVLPIEGAQVETTITAVALPHATLSPSAQAFWNEMKRQRV